MEKNLYQNKPCSLILWNYLQATFDITAIVPLYYQGLIAGSEFETYAATKLYMCHSLIINGGVFTTASLLLNLYDENNVQCFRLGNDSICYDTTVPAQRYYANTCEITNLYFSRIMRVNVAEMIYIGYRITIT